MYKLMSNKTVYGIAGAGTVAIAIVAVIVSYQGVQANVDPESMVQRLLAPVPNVSALGSPDAKMTIVEFGDYRCVHCARFSLETKDLLLSEYVDTGKSRFIFRDFPVNDRPGDKSSAVAAEASYCAAEQGKYWEYHDRLFSNFDFGRNTNVLTKESLKQFASDVGVADAAEFSGCLESGRYSSTVGDNAALARNLGLSGTPALVIVAEGKTPVVIQGFQNIDSFNKEFDNLSTSGN